MTDDPETSDVSANQARACFADLLGRAQYGKERLVIRRRNKPVAARAEAKKKETKSLDRVVRRLRVTA